MSCFSTSSSSLIIGSDGGSCLIAGSDTDSSPTGGSSLNAGSTGDIVIAGYDGDSSLTHCEYGNLTTGCTDCYRLIAGSDTNSSLMVC